MTTTTRELQLASGPRVFCRQENEGAGLPALVLLNGAAFHLQQWKRLLTAGRWVERFRVFRFDYCGTGRSSSRDRPLTIEIMGQEVAELLDALELESAHFYGVSQGTIVLQALAALAPTRIASAAGYGWYYGDYSGLDETLVRVEARVRSLETLRATERWSEPLDEPAFERLWAEVYRRALVGASWEELSLLGRVKDWFFRRALLPLLAPTSIASIHEWFAYCASALRGAQPLLREGLAALSSVPTLVQHATRDETLDVGMARELGAAFPHARIVEYGDDFTHASIAFRSRQASRVVRDHIDHIDHIDAIDAIDAMAPSLAANGTVTALRAESAEACARAGGDRSRA